MNLGRAWLRYGHGLDTPQGIALILSVPVCWIVILLRWVFPDLEEMSAFSSPGGLYLFSPFLGFLAFLRLGYPAFGASWLAAGMVCALSGFPFYVAYLRT
ncbi:MAG: hypothetical protein JZU45_14060 [Methyloversatilis discipulorum]|uniref:hypothetical protein n=1 Tax=Methyloversatilis discipulorum TaxID=1119528 RepID=UPI0026F2E167|nr:hypothetical protein [Methyloversatilis discipulorum]MBV5287201.1 hypothetical protein [Methyloversatilis discipulorum]